MSRRESEASAEYIDTMSSGDSNKTKSKQTPKAKEVNNNEVDELSKELSEMGCVVDAMKRPPNICVETCVYDSDSEKSQAQGDECNEDAYSDEFEEEEESVETEEKSSKTDSRDSQPNRSSVKLSQSQSTVSSNKPPASISERSGRSTDYGLVQKLVPRSISVEWRCGVTACKYHRGRPLTEPLEQSTEGSQMSAPPSVSVPSTRRINMSFTNDRLREIERHNHILLTKILSARNSRKSSIPSREQPPRRPLPSAAVTRKNHQRQIDHDNMILLKKIQRAKSSAYSMRR